MDRVFDRDNRFIGYARDNEVYDRRHRIVGFIREPMVLDAYYNPVAYYYGDVMYTPDGIPWGYFDNRVFRDMSGRRLGRTADSWPGMLSGALLLGRGIGWYPVTYKNQGNGTYNGNYALNDYRENGDRQGRGRQDKNVLSREDVPHGYEAAQYGIGNYRSSGLNGILQNIMGYGRSLLGGLGGFGGGGDYQPRGYDRPRNEGAQARPAGDPVGNNGGYGGGYNAVNTGGGYGSGSSFQNIIGAGRTLMGVVNSLGGIDGVRGLLNGRIPGAMGGGSMQNLDGLVKMLNSLGGQGTAPGAEAAGGPGGLGNLFSGDMGPLGSMVGKYIMHNPQMAMSLLNGFFAR